MSTDSTNSSEYTAMRQAGGAFLGRDCTAAASGLTNRQMPRIITNAAAKGRAMIRKNSPVGISK